MGVDPNVVASWEDGKPGSAGASPPWRAMTRSVIWRCSAAWEPAHVIRSNTSPRSWANAKNSRVMASRRSTGSALAFP